MLLGWEVGHVKADFRNKVFNDLCTETRYLFEKLNGILILGEDDLDSFRKFINGLKLALGY